jgi:DNA-binding PucR family transcriptional regulator
MTNQIFDYSDFYYYDLLYNYTGKIPLEHYCHPALYILRQYDKINNTELYVTLNTYLEHKKNLRTTAEALFIHRNTLVYRINRIHQLTELDLGSVNVLYSLMDSFRIETFLRK